MADVTITQVPITVTVSQGGIQGPAGPSGSWTGSHTGDASITGSLGVTGTITADAFSGSFSGSFEGSFVSGTLGNGIEIIPGSTILRSAGFKGLAKASDNTGPGGFVIYSGSNQTYLFSDQLQGTGFKFVGTSGSSYITFTDQDGGDFTIKTDKFTLQNNGDITASNAVFSGTARANNFVEAQVTVSGPGTNETYPSSNFSSYIVGDYATQPGATLYLDGTQSGTVTTNVDIVAIDLSDPIYISDIKVKDETTLVNEKVNVTLKNNVNSAVSILFNINTPKGTGYSSSMAPGNIYDMEISFGSEPGAENKTITALRATDLSLPITASAGGINISGSLSITDFEVTNRVGIGTSSPSRRLHVESSTSADGIRLGGFPNPQIEFASGSNVVGRIGIPTGNGAYASGSLKGDLVFRYDAGNLIFASGSTATPSLMLSQSRVLVGGLNGRESIDPALALRVLGRVQIDHGGSVYIGESAGENDDQSNNNNIGIGNLALNSVTSGDYNIAIGYQALQDYSRTGTGNNIAIGWTSQRENTAGAGNISLGNATLGANQKSSDNIAIGTLALLYLNPSTSGTYNSNIAIGSNAGRFTSDASTVTLLSGSVLIGQLTRPLANDEENVVIIGHQAVGIGSNSVVLGNDNITTTALKGNVGIGTTAPSASLHVYDVSGSIIAPTSSGVPTFDGTDGQFVFGTDGGNHYIYTWMAGAWRSGSLS